MKKTSTQKEILLITGTSFSSRQWCEKNDNSNQKPLSEIEQLEEACWNGLIQEILPEVFGEPAKTKSLYLWHITEGASFLELDLSEFPVSKDKYFSLDPYTFLEVQSYN
jgi:hypothetical protein